MTLGRALPTDAYDYNLPTGLIAQAPVEPRHASRLMTVNRGSGDVGHRAFSDLADWLDPRDLLVVNRSRVIAARLTFPLPTGGAGELLLLRREAVGTWETLARPGRRLRPGTIIELSKDLAARVVATTPAGGRIVRFEGHGDPDEAALALGQPPLPPYIKGWTGDPERYQTIYADMPGSAAAPTAGLHFSDGLLAQLRDRGVSWARIVLHVGLDTFRPVRARDLSRHEIHSEYAEVGGDVARDIKRTRERGGRVVAVGTTTVRALETAALAETGLVAPWHGQTSLFIVQGHRFRVVDAMITNFHLPRSTLLALVCAFAGRDLIMRAYHEAIECRYRFFSFGDAMLIH